MQYSLLDDPGQLQVEYEGPPLDALTIGVLETQLHKIAEKVALFTLIKDVPARLILLEHPDLVPIEFWQRWRPGFWWLYEREFVDFRRPVPLVRLRTDEVRTGSFYQDLSVVVAHVLIAPDTRAVLQGFIGNMLFAIFQSGIRGVMWRKRDSEPTNDTSESPTTLDPFEVGDNVRAITCAIAANSEGKNWKLKIKDKRGQEIVAEIEVDVRQS